MPGSPEHLRPGHLHHLRHPGHPHPAELRLLAVHVWTHHAGARAGSEKADKQVRSSAQRSFINDVGKINKKLSLRRQQSFLMLQKMLKQFQFVQRGNTMSQGYLGKLENFKIPSLIRFCVLQIE